MKNKKEDLRFEIDQLRKDKMVYALESCAISFGAVLVFFLLVALSGTPGPNNQPLIDPVTFNTVGIAAAIVGLVYMVFAVVGNLMRYSRIKFLESQLQKKK